MGCCSGCPPAPAPDSAEEQMVDKERGDGDCLLKQDSITGPIRKDTTEEPDCCKGKSSPCCDTSCLDRLALRACQDERQQGIGKGNSPPSLKLVMSWTQEQGTLQLPHTQDQRLSMEKVDTCCPDRCCETKPRPTQPGTSRPIQEQLGSGCQNSCCDQSQPVASRIVQRQAPSCCSPGTSCGSESLGPVTACAAENANCCGKEPPPDSMTSDLEQGLSSSEHIVLSITGMTCTGCETKLHRTLGTLAGIKNLKTSLVLSRAEFDLENGSLADVTKHVERTTEFKCQRVKKGASVDAIVSGGAARLTGEQWPKGVTDIALINDTTVNISYDPQLVGARDLVERGWDHVKHIGLMMLLSIILTIPVLVLAWAPLHGNEIAYESAALALATLVQVLVAGPFYPKALKALVFSRVIEMDLLIVLSTSAAYIFSVVSFACLVAGQPLSTGSFFETSTLLVTLIMVGRYVAALARQKAVESISIRSLQVNTAILVHANGDNGKEIDARLLQLGDTFRVMPESRIPTDGIVISGTSEVDESMITGESRPAEKSKGAVVIAGTINGSSTLLVRVTRIPGDNTIDTIAAMVDQAKLSKPKMQHLADRVASCFVPVITVLMAITFITWIAVGIRVRGEPAREAAIEAVTYAITVLIVCCPCAIGLAVPMVIVIATGVGAEHGVIFKSAESIEVAYKANHVILDKTGTLTEGALSVVHYEQIDDEPANMSLLLELVEDIKHPVSVAVAAFLKDKGIVTSSKVNDIKSLPGKGVQGFTSTGQILRAGNSRWLDVKSEPCIQRLQAAGHTVICFEIDNTLAAVFGLQDTLRQETLTTVQALQDRNISVHVLSGDDDGAVRVVTEHLGIPNSNVRSRCTPADKQLYVQDILSTSPKSVVIFCGDGTNDAVALAQATVGIVINRSSDSAAEVAKSAADIVLMRPDLQGILTVIDLSRKSVHRIIFNFCWSFVYNLFAVLLAAGAFVSLNNARIPPQFAGLGELVSVLPVILAAVLLRWAKV
ncbi:E1-E2 ATPase-domain-containing protein [Apiosordaria backusii]|uniref:E1-E2 ATPase-domain-containing protein n=1 Tax=Apiosordaria backusii TaxID=314023 RepID=A0AA40EXF7_9PEZI|nr:E1-E2 ATPase-domain-containing protein [Apiosordaria backusii]